MIQIETVLLKDILNKVGKCASNNKAEPLTQLLHIHAVGNELKFTTTNQIDTCIYTHRLQPNQIDYPEFDVSIMVDSFIKLVSKFTCATTCLSLSETGNEIIITGNGTYKLPLPLDGPEPIKYPALTSDITPQSNKYVGPIYNIIAAAKSTEGSITKFSADLEMADYPRTNYYFDESGCVSLDGYKASWYKDDCLLPFKALIYPSTIKVLSIFDIADNDTEVYKCTSGEIVFVTPNITLISKEARGTEVFPYEVATSLINAAIDAETQVAAGHFMSALDRIKLFIASIDDNCIKLEFSDKGLFLFNCNKSCTEQISAEALEDFECFIDIDNLTSQLKSYDSDDIVTLGYGNDQFIQLSSDCIGQIVVLSQTEGA